MPPGNGLWLRVLGWLLLLVCCVAQAQTTPEAPRAVAGVLDLRGWDFERDGNVRLDGEWTFSWDASRQNPSGVSSTIKVPGAWTEAGHPNRGKALYHLRVLTPPSSAVYGLKIYEFPQSYRLYLGDRLLIENGRYAENPDQAARSLVRPLVSFASPSGVHDLWIEAVNRSEPNPGPRRSLMLGLEPAMRRMQDGQTLSDMLLIGALLIMGLYHLGLYLQRRRDLGSLLFGALCLIMVLRICVTEEHYLHKAFPGFPGGLEHTLDTFSFLVLAPAFAWIFWHFFRQDFRASVLRMVTLTFLILAPLYLLLRLDPLFNLYMGFTMLVALYLGWVLFLGVRHNRFGSRVFLAGFLIFVGTAVWDMLSYLNVIRVGYISQFGFVCFLFAQAYVLSMRFNRALVTSEQLSQNLERLVLERTEALEDSNRQLAALNITDALTGIANRRHFDTQFQLEWQRAQRNGRPLGLLVLDIDHFKGYNDHYGHPGGDACLQAVAGILAQTVGRAGDTVARYGGEEFVALLPEGTPDQALELAERLRQNIETAALPHAKSHLGFVSVSIGVQSAVPRETDTLEGFFKVADDALYRAKGQGRNRAVLAVPAV